MRISAMTLSLVTATFLTAGEYAASNATNPSPPPPIFRKLGLDVNGSIITIDTQKTSRFLNHLGRRLDAIGRSIEANGTLPKSDEDLGIRVEGKRIEIDLNRTEKALRYWVDVLRMLGEAMQSELQEEEP
ncbi:hypothetical protein [Nitratifractor sp.]